MAHSNCRFSELVWIRVRSWQAAWWDSPVHVQEKQFSSSDIRSLSNVHNKKTLKTYCTPAPITVYYEHVSNLLLFKKYVCVNSTSDIETEAIPLGLIGRRVANKGAIVLKMRIGRASCAFITSHLKAGHTSVAGRNKDIDHVLSQLHFTHSDMDCLFWFGDLNYR